MNPKSKQQQKKSTNTSKSFQDSKTPVVQHTSRIQQLQLAQNCQISEELRRWPISATGTFGKVRKHAYTRTSPYWKHFALKNDENDELRIHCNYCTKTFKNEGT
ncbi:hypothetical protein DAPPUDRAFT_329810 [Daphnia pulex]|uniref:BED-type domain-containing protein n=1 Tax=Daphnia pulex TaxID=6669 RepID=E9HHP2_DAPPU|nr:hypothetical protein DAPPUDRAFT_329810 [Daphnia pulex]|eukprot:EFX68739.1 hypothetical protein DAPPUDRAFT_329810 [Daphnia pulex]